MDTLDAERVVYVAGSAAGFYFETDKRLICLPTDEISSPRCWVWPAGLPRVVRVFTRHDKQGKLRGSDITGVEGTVVLRSTWDPNRKDRPLLSVTQVRPKPNPISRKRTASPSFTMPPSRRPTVQRKRAKLSGWPPGGTLLVAADDDGANAVVRAIASVRTSDKPPPDLFSAEKAGTSLVSVAERDFDGESEHIWSCYRVAGARRACGESRLVDFILVGTLPAGWLVLANDGGYRWGKSALVWVTVSEGSLVTFALDVGRSEGTGEACGFADSYCMWMEGVWTPFDVLSPGCVRIGKTTLWSATHVRVGNRWIDEQRKAAPSTFQPAPGSYRPSAKGWVRAQCVGR